MYTIRDHPEIRWAELTGYPSYNQEEFYKCDRCHDELNPDEVYEDESYGCLCSSCLLRLHEKVW